MNQEVYFFRNNSKESNEAKRALDENHLKYVEIFSTSDRELPCLIPTDSAVPYCGEDGIKLYISFFSNIP